MKTENSPPTQPVIGLWRSMLDQGVALEHVVKMAQKHIAALQDLPDVVEGKSEAIAECSEWLTANKE